MSRSFKPVYKLIILFLFFAVIIRADDSGDFSFKLGLGYDFVSQEYFLSSSRYDTSFAPDPDGLLTATLLKKDYLDDKKGLVYFKYDSKAEGRFILEAGWEQTPDLFRALGWAHFSLGSYGNRLETDFNLEVKERCRGAAEAGEELSVFEGEVDYRRRFSESAESKFRLFGERVAFDSTGLLVYDYSRVGGEVGISINTTDFSTLYVSTHIEKRNVPDSCQLDYSLIRGNLGYFGTLLGSQISGELAVESKDYGWSDSRDDYTLTTFFSNLKVPIGQGFFLRLESHLENFNFRVEGSFNNDYILARSGLILGREYDLISVTLGPKIEVLSIETDYQNDDDYFEYLAFAGFDYYSYGGIFLLVENELGKRNYRNDPSYYSDFTFNRVSIIGTLKILKNLSVDILFSAEWEWHKIDSDDSRLYLFSSGLTYSSSL